MPVIEGVTGIVSYKFWGKHVHMTRSHVEFIAQILTRPAEGVHVDDFNKKLHTLKVMSTRINRLLEDQRPYNEPKIKVALRKHRFYIVFEEVVDLL